MPVNEKLRRLLDPNSTKLEKISGSKELQILLESGNYTDIFETALPSLKKFHLTGNLEPLMVHLITEILSDSEKVDLIRNVRRNMKDELLVIQALPIYEFDNDSQSKLFIKNFMTSQSPFDKATRSYDQGRGSLAVANLFIKLWMVLPAKMTEYIKQEIGDE